MIDNQELTSEELDEQKGDFTIFNTTDKNKGKLSIFTGDDWLLLDGKHAAYIYRMDNKITALQEQLTTTQQALEQLEEDNASLEESLSALTNKLGDNCCACSYDNIEDVCMVHTPKLKQTQKALDDLKDITNDLAQANQKCDLEIKTLQQALDSTKKVFEDVLAAIEIRRGELGAIDSYSYDSGVEYGLRLTSIKLEAALASIKG